MTGSWLSSDNIGDHAVYDAVSSSLCRFVGADIRYVTSNPRKVRELYGVEAYAPRRSPFSILRLIIGADMLMFPGNVPFYDEKSHMFYFAALVAVARLWGTAVVVFSIGLREFSSRAGTAALRFICRNAAFLGGREEETLERLRYYSGGKVLAGLVPDPATQLTPIDPPTAFELLEQEGVDATSPSIAICLRSLRADKAFHAHYDKAYDAHTISNYVPGIAKLARYAIRKLDHNVVFLPMNTHAPDDDRIVARLVYDELSHDQAVRERVRLIERQFRPREMKGILGHFNALVGVRYHALVLAASMRTPIIAVAYAPKHYSIMRFIGIEDCCTNIENTSSDVLCERLDHVLTKRDLLVEGLAQRLGEINELYERRMRQILDIVAANRRK